MSDTHTEQEIWAEYFRVKNELMDLWDFFIESITLVKLTKELGKNPKRIRIHELGAKRALTLLYYKGIPSGAITKNDQIEEALNKETIDITDYFTIADTIRDGFETVGLYKITKEKGNPAKSITHDRSY